VFSPSGGQVASGCRRPSAHQGSAPNQSDRACDSAPLLSLPLLGRCGPDEPFRRRVL